jgi:hypothetical protein
MDLDRRPGCFFDVTLRIAIKRSRDSAAEARRLLEAGFPSPAYVWAVRSVEIFVKEVMLLPLFLIEIEGKPDEFDRVWGEARQRISDTFGSGRWDSALRKVDKAFGPLAPMRTDDGKEVWSEWKSKVVPRRGNTVHGRPTGDGDPSAAEAALVVQWADQMMDQLTLRLIATGTHPLHDLFVAAFDNVAEAYRAAEVAKVEQGTIGPASPGSG